MTRNAVTLAAEWVTLLPLFRPFRQDGVVDEGRFHRERRAAILREQPQVKVVRPRSAHSMVRDGRRLRPVRHSRRRDQDATAKRYHYESHNQLVRHLDNFVAAYNFGRRLKTLNGLTPFKFVCKLWTTEPERFRLNPLQQMPGLNS